MLNLTLHASETPQLSAAERLIVALDTPTVEQAERLVTDLGSSVQFYKIGWRLYLTAGMDFVKKVRAQDKKIFLDLKMDDIAETIQTAVAVIKDEVHLITLFGGPATVRAAVAGRGEAEYPKLLSVTFLSSLDESDLRAGLPQSLNLPAEDLLPGYIRQRAQAAVEAGADGLIASGDSVKQLREALGPQPLLVTPGIRPGGSSKDDHKRSKTPAEAIAEGSDYLVVGRPVWGAENPVKAAEAIIAEIQDGLDRR